MFETQSLYTDRHLSFLTQRTVTVTNQSEPTINLQNIECSPLVRPLPPPDVGGVGCCCCGAALISDAVAFSSSDCPFISVHTYARITCMSQNPLDTVSCSLGAQFTVAPCKFVIEIVRLPPLSSQQGALEFSLSRERRGVSGVTAGSSAPFSSFLHEYSWHLGHRA